MDVGGDDAKWAELREKKKKEAEAKKLEQANADREQRIKDRRKQNEQLEFKTGLEVMVQDLANNNEKNGAIGTLGEYNSSKDRWAVAFSSGSSNNFKIDNLVLQGPKESVAASLDEGDEIPTSKVYITNLSEDTTEDNLIKLFATMGTLAREPVKNAKGSSKGYEDQWPFAVKLYKPGVQGGDACVGYVDKLCARDAIRKFDGHVLKGSAIKVAYAGAYQKPDDPKDRVRSRSRERIRKLEAERKAELAAVTQRIKENEPMSEKAYMRL